MKKRLIFLTAILLFLETLSASSVLIRTEAHPKDVYIGDQIRYQITVTFSPEITSLPVKIEQNLGEFEILSSQSTPAIDQKEGKKTISHNFILTIFSTGTFNIPSIALPFSAKDGSVSEAKTEEIAIKVKSLLEEKGNEGHLRPLKGLFDVRSMLWLWILLGIATLILFIYFLRKWIKNKNIKGIHKKEPARPADEIALEAISQLENENLISQGNVKEFYFRLSIICRQYLENRYGLSAIEKTSSELYSEFRKMNLSLENTNRLRDLFDNADLVKFAKFTPAAEDVPLDLERARQFITLTTPPPAPTGEPTARESIPV